MLRINHIRLRAEPTGGLYGADVRLNGGLTVLHAPNTSGKSTVLHAFLYALGLEQMLSPRREIPLSYAMREYVENPANGVEQPGCPAGGLRGLYRQPALRGLGGAARTLR